MAQENPKAESGKRKAERPAEASPKKKKLTARQRIQANVKKCQPEQIKIGNRKSEIGNKSSGRPSVYLSKYCADIINFMAKGFSLTAFAGHIGVSRETIYAWTETHKEFSDALTKARAARTFYWEKRLEVAGPDARAVIFALRNSCADEWKNNPDENGVNVTVNNDIAVDTSKPVEQWGEAEILAELKRLGVTPVTATTKTATAGEKRKAESGNGSGNQHPAATTKTA